MLVEIKIEVSVETLLDGLGVVGEIIDPEWSITNIEKLAEGDYLFTLAHPEATPKEGLA